MATFSGVWRNGTGKYHAQMGLDTAAIVSMNTDMQTRGLHLSTVRNYRAAAQRLWAGNWREGVAQSQLHVDLTQAAFFAKFDALVSTGFRLRSFDVYPTENGNRWAGAWESGTDRSYLFAEADWPHFQSKYNELTNQGLRLRCLRTYRSGGVRVWAGSFREGNENHFVFVEANWAVFKAKYDSLKTVAKLVALVSYFDSGTALYGGVWAAANATERLNVNANWVQFAELDQAAQTAGMPLEVFEVTAHDALFTLPLHLRVLAAPAIPINTMLANMQRVYATAGIDIDLRSFENTSALGLLDINTNGCFDDSALTPRQLALFDIRNPSVPGQMVVYFVRSTTSGEVGCARYPSTKPGVLVTSNASQWTLAHEVAHVLGLNHTSGSTALMTPNTSLIVGIPVLSRTEITTMRTNGVNDGLIFAS